MSVSGSSSQHLCIHIGYRRTGTSFLASILYKLCENAGRLSERPELLRRFQAVDPSVTPRMTVFELPDGTLLCPWINLLGDLDCDRLDLIDRLAQELPKARIVVTLRNQVDLLRGTYFLWVKGGNLGDFERFVADRADRLFRFDTVVDRLYQRFGRDRVLIALHDDLLRDPKATVRELMEFAGNGQLADRFVPESRRPVKPTASDFVVRLWEVRNMLLRPLYKVAPGVADAIRRVGLPGHRLLESGLGRFGKGALVDRDSAALIARAYAEENAALFARLGKSPADYSYPGQRAV